jgi:hypothetical protein
MTRWRGPLFAHWGALPFGVSPLADLRLGQTPQQWLAGLLYLGSGTGLALVLLGRHMAVSTWESRQPLTRREWPWLAGAILFGGIIAPRTMRALAVGH